MKNRFILTLGLALVTVFSVFFPSCSLVTVDDPNFNANDQYKLEYVIQGTVMVADDYQAIGSATVRIGSMETTTDANGIFSFTTKTLPASGTMIEVSRDGFVAGSTPFTYGSNLPTQSVYDFLLTRKNQFNTLNVLAGGQFQVGDLTVIMPSGNQVSVNGQSVSEIDINITPILRNSTFGVPADEGKRFVQLFDFQPAGAIFSKPIQISFAVENGNNFANLEFVKLNSATNQWEPVQTTVTYNAVTKSLNMEIPAFNGTAGVIDHSTIVYDPSYDPTNGADFYVAPWKVVEASTCNCEGPILFSHESPWLLQITNEGTASWDELLEYGIFSTSSISFIPTLISGIPRTFQIGGSSPIPITDCFWYKWDLAEVYQRVKGTFVYTDQNGISETKTFDLKFRRFISSSDSYFPSSPSYGGCPVSSNCHQGGHQGGTSGC